MDTKQFESFATLLNSAKTKISNHLESRIAERVEATKVAIEAQTQKTIRVESIKIAAKRIQNSKRMMLIQREVIDNHKKFFYFLIVHFFSAAPTLFLLLVAVVVALPLGVFIGLNLPEAVVCSDRGICYNWRGNKETVIFPGEKTDR